MLFFFRLKYLPQKQEGVLNLNYFLPFGDGIGGGGCYVTCCTNFYLIASTFFRAPS